MKKRKLYLLCAIVLILSFIVSGCKKNSQATTHPSNYQQLAGLIGKTMSDVCKELNVKKDKLDNPAIGLYLLPDKIEYCGHSFEILLNFDVTSDEETLYGFWYRTIFTDDMGKAATFIDELAEKFTSKYDAWDLYSVSNRITEQNNLVELLDKDDIVTTSEVFDLSKEVTDNMKEYMSNYKEKNAKSLEYGMVLLANSTEDSQVILTLKYEMKVNPNK